MHNVGRQTGGAWYEHVRVGWNYRMTEWQGAILRVQLGRLPEQMAVRDRNARYLASELARLNLGVAPLAVDQRVTQHAWHIFALRYQPEAFGGWPREAFVGALNAEGIPSSLGYVPLTESPAIMAAFTQQNAGRPRPCPVSERVADSEAIWLAQNLLLGSRSDIDDIIEAIAKIQRVKGQ